MYDPPFPYFSLIPPTIVPQKQPFPSSISLFILQSPLYLCLAPSSHLLHLSLCPTLPFNATSIPSFPCFPLITPPLTSPSNLKYTCFHPIYPYLSSNLPLNPVSSLLPIYFAFPLLIYSPLLTLFTLSLWLLIYPLILPYSTRIFTLFPPLLL